jgi:GT2 family glycosyltransferase
LKTPVTERKKRHTSRGSAGTRMKPIETGRVRGVEGKWVLVLNDRVIVSSDSAEKVFREATEYPPEQVVVTRILSGGASFY